MIRRCYLLLVALSLCISSADATAAPLPLIPMPAKVSVRPGHLVLHDGDTLAVRSGDPQALGIAQHFAELLARTRGIQLRVLTAGGSAHAQMVFDVAHNHGQSPGAEGYHLQVDKDGIQLTAGTPAGLFYGSVTLWQLLTPDASRSTTADLPYMSIEDQPRFAWRALLLDSARHFQSVADIERLIDWMALHKLNVLQWHLTDDQGWRLEIKKYPKLTSVGACRKAVGPDAVLTGSPDKPYCGFYTQAEARAIVAYAAERYVAVVPEIEMPGHAQAAIASYPEFGVTGSRPEVSTDWGVHPYLYDVDDSTLRFLDDVLDEVMAVFPSSYIDVGGDEALKDQWKASKAVQVRMHALKIGDEDALQGWFITRIGNYLHDHGRKLIGWDGILVQGLPPDAAVMVWQSPDLTSQALKQQHDVVIAYSPTLYLDDYQSAAHDEPPGRPPVVSLKDVYGFDPMSGQPGVVGAAQVLGEQINLWTEYMPTFARDEHAIFPRTAAFAETAWSPASARDWDGFLARLPAQFARYRALGIGYADSAFAPATQAPASIAPDVRNSDQLSTCAEKLVLRIEGERPLDGPRPVYRVDIMDMCWLWKAAPFTGMGHIAIALGNMPWNYQLAHDIDKVVVRPMPDGQDELEVHLDDCDGRLLTRFSLQQAAASGLVSTLNAPLPAISGDHDLCIFVTGDPKRRLWAVDTVRLTP